MQTFNFHLDEKATVWCRTEFEIEAKNLAEAKKLAIKFHKERETDSIGWDIIEDTIEIMSVEDNDDQHTQELTCEEDGLKIFINN